MVNLDLWNNICLKYKEEIGDQLYDFLLSDAKPYIISNEEAVIIVDDFIKKSSIIYYTKDALRKVKDHVINVAESEGLTAHANSIKVRFQGE